MKASRKMLSKPSQSKPTLVGRSQRLRTPRNSSKSSQAETPPVEAVVEAVVQPVVQPDQPIDELSEMKHKIRILKMIVSSLIGQTTSTLARKEQLLEEEVDALRKREAGLLLKLRNANRLYAELEQECAQSMLEKKKN